MKVFDKINVLTIVFITLIFLWGGYAYKHSLRYQSSKMFDEIVIKDLGVKINDGFVQFKQDGAIGVDQTTDWCETITRLQCGGACRSNQHWSTSEQLRCGEWSEETSAFHFE